METHKNEPDGTCYCKFCYEKFIDEAMYEQHLLKHHSEQEHLTSHNSGTKDGTKDLSGEEHEINCPLEEEEVISTNSCIVRCIKGLQSMILFRIMPKFILLSRLAIQ
jgi:hypothetical protein